MPLLPAVIGIILNDDQTQVLLVKRQDVPVWVLPGGGVEKDENPEEALIREIEEETGYKVKIIRQSANYFPINRLAALTSVFICNIISGEERESSETASVAFFPLNQLPRTFFFPHLIWLKEAFKHHELIRRPLREISYYELFKYFLRNPLQVLRFAWTRFTKK